MERQIKFRAWDGEKMHNVIYYKGGKRCVVPLNRFPGQEEIIAESIMQFTGLLDKNGVEIYEGDVMQWPNQDEKGIVIYDENGCQFRIKLNDYASLHIGLNIGEKGQAIVIGNIHTKS